MTRPRPRCVPRTATGTPATSAIGTAGNLRLIDRARDFLVTTGGKTIAPAMIENLLRASPYIAEAIVIGQGRRRITALIEIDPDTVSDWARGRAHGRVETATCLLSRAPRSSGSLRHWNSERYRNHCVSASGRAVRSRIC